MTWEGVKKETLERGNWVEGTIEIVGERYKGGSRMSVTSKKSFWWKLGGELQWL